MIDAMTVPPNPAGQPDAQEALRLGQSSQPRAGGWRRQSAR